MWRLLTFVCVFGFSYHAHASYTLLTIDLRPAGYIESYQPKGIHYDVINEIAERAQIEYVSKVKPYARVVHEMKNGTAAMSLLFYDRTLEQDVIYVAPVLQTNLAVLSSVDKPVRSLNDLVGQKVGVLRKALAIGKVPYLDQATPYLLKDYLQGVEMVYRGRLDSMIGADLAIYHAMQKLKRRKSDFNPLLIIQPKEVLLVVSKGLGHEVLLNKLKGAIDNIKKDGTIDKIVENYTEYEP